ncbi:serine hydrolase domain-containing protein [Microlunatus speluncae]|uniref:serine hydrolase domain-containing protein n=1 Tax=Microlunatus speluncae TaxID=2594267 RepID=UPI001266876E|nr:serine hydrolase [Microlunatus speluncae]
MSFRFPRSTPAEQQVDATGVQAFLDTVEAAADLEPHSLMIVRRGSVVAEGWWAPYSADRVHLLYSLSKSFTSTAVGLAAAEGLLDLDDPLVSYFPEFDAEITDPRSRAIRLRHVASMASGHRQEMIEAARRADPDEPIRGFLLSPPEEEPGSVFAYNQPCTYALAAVVQRRSGMRLTEYLRPRLFDPLGIGEVGWQRDARSRELGFSGLHARTEDIAKLGQLYLQGGVWQGEQLLPAEWVREATRSHVATTAWPTVDWQQGYGFQFWQSRHGFRGDGAYGQFCLVLPEQEAVVAITSATIDMQALLDAVWAHLLPALGAADGPTDPVADELLAKRLRSLTLAPVAGSATPPGGLDRWTDQPFAVPAAADAVRLVDAVRLLGGEAEPRLELTTPTGILTAPIGIDRWTVTERPAPMACSGGWLDDDTFRAEVIMLDTPHRLLLSCRLPERVAEVGWREPPLHGLPLAEMRSGGGWT